MAFEFKLPDVGEGLHEAEIVAWKVKVGDVVREDQPLVEVQTDKATVELTSPVAGRVVALHGNPGDVLAVGTVIAVIETGDGAPAAAPAATPQAAAAPAAAAPAPAPATPVAPAAAPAAPPAAAPAHPGGRALATPATRRRARELGIDINQVPGTGKGGRVTTEDVERFAAALKGGTVPAAPASAAAVPAAAPAAGDAAQAAATAQAGTAPAVVPGRRIPLRGVRRAIAAAMVKSKHTAPHVTVVDEADFTELVALRERARALAEARGVKLTYLPFIIKALVAALREFPLLNARLDDEAQEIVVHGEYNIGIAVDTEAGLLVPVIKNADRKSVLELAQEISELSAKARAGKLTLEEMRGGTFSITNQGSVGGLFFTPIINWPEVAILGVGKIHERPVVRDGQVVVRKMCYLVVSFDHRVIDGALAARFLSRICEYLSNPTLLLMEMV